MTAPNPTTQIAGTATGRERENADAVTAAVAGVEMPMEMRT